MNQSEVDKVKITDPSRILTMANFVSLLRALMALPIIYTLRFPEMAAYTFIFIILAILSDALDGYLARRAHQVTHFGQWLDPIADFVVIIAVTSYLVLVGRFPEWFYIFFLVRYVSIALPAIYFLNHSGFFLSANWYGKWAAGVSGVAILLHIFPLRGLPWLPNTTLWIATGLLSVSWILYFKTYIIEYRKL